MIVFAFVPLGHQLGRWIAALLQAHGAGRGAQNTALIGGLATGVAVGTAAWMVTADDSPGAVAADLHGLVHPLLGSATDLVVAVLLIARLIGELYGICLTVALVILAVGEVLATVLRRRGYPVDDVDVERPWLFGQHSDVIDRHGRVTIRSAWRTATCAYGLAVATAAHSIGADLVQLDVCGIQECHLHLDADGIAAQWNCVEGWSAMTVRGRHWYPAELVPSPRAIALWLRQVGDEPWRGSGWPPQWRPDGEGADLAAADVLDRLLAVSVGLAGQPLLLEPQTGDG